MKSLSLLTVSFNSEKTIQDCFESIQKQSIRPNEYIIIDGGSNDMTLSTILEFHSFGVVTTFISEADNGISDAFNKGINISSSEYIAFINSDDRLSEDYMKRIKPHLDGKNEIILSNIRYYSERKSVFIIPKFEKNNPIVEWYHPDINHAGMIIKKSLLQDIGCFNTKFKYAMDIDLFYRLLKSKPKIRYIDFIGAHQSFGGKSSKRWVKALIEVSTIEINNGRCFLAAYSALFLRITKRLILKFCFRDF